MKHIPQWIPSDSSMNSLGFLNEFTQIPQGIHSVSTMNLLWFLNESTRIPQWIHWNSSMNSLEFLNEFIKIHQQFHQLIHSQIELNLSTDTFDCKKYRIFSTFLKYSPIFLNTSFLLMKSSMISQMNSLNLI